MKTSRERALTFTPTPVGAPLPQALLGKFAQVQVSTGATIGMPASMGTPESTGSCIGSTQRLSVQTWPPLQTLQLSAAAPQASAVVPSRHCPSASQQPPQVAG